MSRFALAALALAIAPSAIAAPSVATFGLDAKIVVDKKAGTVAIDGDVQYSSCTTDLVKETPIDPAFLPCDDGAAFVLLVDKTGAPSFGFHGVVDRATDASITLRGDDLLLVGDTDVDPEFTSTDVYGIWGTDGAVIPDLLAIWGTNGAAIWGTDGVRVPADEKTGMWSGDITAVWGTDGAAIWGTGGAIITDDLVGVVASPDFLPELEADPVEAYKSLPSTDLTVLIEERIAAPLTTVGAAEMAMHPLAITQACEIFGCK